MNVLQLMKLVEKDLDSQDSDYSMGCKYGETTNTLTLQLKDPMGVIEYVVPDTSELVAKVIRDYNADGISEVDAFWSIMNSEYKI